MNIMDKNRDQKKFGLTLKVWLVKGTWTWDFLVLLGIGGDLDGAWHNWWCYVASPKRRRKYLPFCAIYALKMNWKTCPFWSNLRPRGVFYDQTCSKPWGLKALWWLGACWASLLATLENRPVWEEWRRTRWQHKPKQLKKWSSQTNRQRQLVEGNYGELEC